MAQGIGHKVYFLFFWDLPLTPYAICHDCPTPESRRLEHCFQDKELRGFAPIGILELGNTGIMGLGELTEWVIGKIKLKIHKRNEKFGSNPFGKRRIYIIPLFHHSIIPWVRQDYQALVNIYNFNKL
jgi:hypothetical protein